ncbi:PAS domain S-box protein [Kamptonema sp. UHCC 0994]|uniref:PAS domain-containing sensor histidine kinase n=1 Tax=Kamptonema sp. UHCC 0994 TaxID=3031329 RepID=UPI0023B9E61E|nr:PAS domain S-box protein [Kamptonema sp. UHCC 0994]MDF0553666.1 PAS domain S-box protein [Kamptonema sp. UHCC 0994]
MKFRFSPYLAALSAVAVVVSSIWLLDCSEQEQLQHENRVNTVKDLSIVQVNFKGNLNSQRFVAQDLVAQIFVNPDIPKAKALWVRIVSALLAVLTGILVFKWTREPVKLREIVQETTGKLRESEVKYRELVENANSIIVKVDAVGKITFFNDFAQKFFGYSEEEIIGKNAIGTIIPHTDSAGNDLAAMGEDILRQPEKYICNEHENIRKNGESVWISWRNKALVDDKGCFKGILAIGNDISRRKQAEKAQKESYTLLQAVIESVPDPIYVRDLQGRYVLANSATIEAFDRQPEEVIGNSDSELISPEIAQEFLEIDRQIIATGKSLTYSQDFALSGEIRSFLTTKSVYRDSEGNALGVIGISRDITERKQAEIALQRANEELEIRVGKRTENLNQALKQLQTQIAERQQTEEELRKSEERWQLALKGANDGIWDWNPKNNELFLSARCKEMLGFEDREIENDLNAWYSLIHPDDLDRVINAGQDNLEGKTSYFIAEYRIRCKDGSYKWILGRGKALRNEEEIPVRMVGSIADITDRKVAEEALRESESKFQNLSANVPGMLYQFLLRADGSGSYPYISPACSEIFEIEPETVKQNITLIHDLIHPDERQNYDRLVARAAQTMQPWDWQGRFVLPSGKIKWIQSISQPEDLGNGDSIWHGLITDISDRKLAEEALRQSEERWQLALKGNSDGIWDWNIKTNELFTSARSKEIVGYEDHEIGNQLDEWTGIVHPEDINLVIDAMQDHLNQKTPYYVTEHRHRCKDGSYKWILGRGKALWDEEGKPVRVVGSHTDISDRKQAEEALRQSEAREREKSQQLEKTLVQLRSTQAQLIQTEKMSSLGQLVAGIAHEINNPVNFIHGNITYVNGYVEELLGLLELYQQEYPLPSGEIRDRIEEIELEFLTEDLAKTLSSMKVGTERIRSIVLSLRNFSRLDESDMKQVDIHEGIESTLLILQNRFKCKNNCPDIQLVKQFGALLLVECYAGQLNQVFMNVIANAIDAIEQRFKGQSVEEIEANPGRICICTKVRDRDTAIIEISDNGSGMPEAVKTQIFNPFFTTKEVGKGTGLGMSISYQIVVEQHKGKLDCISKVGQGTTFIIEIPIKN